ncbi:MAG: diaminopimelate decarboxylase [Myxococcales bacterium]|nr:diaminopimelate decarboxylase [Myxococcales bacterium]
MSTTRDERGRLLLGGVVLEELARSAEVGTPAYVYDLDAMDADARALTEAFEGAPHLVAYAVKANSAAPIVRSFAKLGLGADVVSGGELLLALGAGIPADRVVMSGVAKSDEELDLALGAGDRGILAVQLESVEEIARVAARARALGRVARVSLRVNPGLDPDEIATHANIATGHDEAKFGVPLARFGEALAAVAARPELDLFGLSSHVGSQFVSTDAYERGAEVLFGLARQALARGARLRTLDTGGGFGIDYGAGCPVRPADFVRRTRARARAHGLEHLTHVVEPGRSLVGAHGVLIASVLQRKTDAPRDDEGFEGGGRDIAGARRWLMIDAGMNDLMRPALYQANHRVAPLGAPGGPTRAVRVVGPVCESSDDFGFHALPTRATGELEGALAAVALLDAGAYGFSMASRYNGRPLAAEVFVRGGRVVALRERAPLAAWAAEALALREE